MRDRLNLSCLFLLSFILIVLLQSCNESNRDRAVCAGDSLSILSFNIRYGTADDGENHWRNRKAILFEFWDKTSADIVGVQEALHFQIKAICDSFPMYDYIGVGRDDGDTLGEYSAIIYKKPLLRVLDQGTFWLSDHPDSVASIDWGNACTRICTWGLFQSKSSGKKLAVFNLHLDHISQVSREKSTILIRKRINGIEPLIPVVVTGDFNAGEHNQAILNLLDGTGQRRFFDSFRIKHPHTLQVGTFNGFEGRTDGEKIDYVLTDNSIEVLKAKILKFNKNGKYPSDHFPVYSQICF